MVPHDLSLRPIPALLCPFYLTTKPWGSRKSPPWYNWGTKAGNSHDEAANGDYRGNPETYLYTKEKGQPSPSLRGPFKQLTPLRY